MQPEPSRSTPLERAPRPTEGAPPPDDSRPAGAADSTESRPRKGTVGRVVLVAAIYVAVIAMAALLWPRPVLLATLYLPLSAFVLYRWRGVETLTCYLTGFVLGPAGEYVAVAAGAWSYAGHESLPIWLPQAWGIAVVVMKQIVVLVGAWVPNERRPG